MLARGDARAAGTGFAQRDVYLDKQRFRYVVYVPVSMPARARPVVLYLHGAGGIGTDDKAQVTTGLAAAIRREPRRFPAIAVFPQASERWVTPRMERLALASLDRTVSEFHADPGREYVMGYSVGAAGAWRIAYLHPHRFAALVAVAGTVRSSRALFEPYEYEADNRAHAYIASGNPYAALARRLRGLPVAIYHGSADSVVPPAESRSIARELRRISSHVRYTEYAGVDHRGVLSKALSDPGLFAWMLAQRRSAVR